MTRLALRRVMMTRGTTQIARGFRTTSGTDMPYALTQHSRETPTGNNRSDLRLGSDGMKLQPAGSHQSRLSAGPPAVPSSSQPCMKLREFYHRGSTAVNPGRLFFACSSAAPCRFRRHGPKNQSIRRISRRMFSPAFSMSSRVRTPFSMACSRRCGKPVAIFISFPAAASL